MGVGGGCVYVCVCGNRCVGCVYVMCVRVGVGLGVDAGVDVDVDVAVGV